MTSLGGEVTSLGGEVTSLGGELVGGETPWWRDDRIPLYFILVRTAKSPRVLYSHSNS